MAPLDHLSELDSQSDRPRTRTRLRGVAPPDAPQVSGTPKNIGRYEIVEVIGRGAMGVVYKARDPLLDRVVAIKTILAPQSLGKSVRKAFLERFEREAKAAARISHHAIVTIFDVGLEAEAPFLVMEYLPGETLADRLDRTRLPLAQGVQCARELASALGFAHRERIVHRDVKPANVLHAGDTRWKLADFGIARLPDSDLTQVGIFMGTPGYAPPEAIREGRYTPQADVFAWGAVFYELLCGRVPYEGPDVQTTNGYVLKNEPASPRVHDPSVPEPLAEVALRALAHDTRRRFASGAEAESALAEAWDRSLAQGLVPVSAFATSSAPSPRAAAPAAPGPNHGAAAHAATALAAPPVAPSAPAAASPPPAMGGNVIARAGAPAPNVVDRSGGLRRPPPPVSAPQAPVTVPEPTTTRDDPPTLVDPNASRRAAQAAHAAQQGHAANRSQSETRATAPWSRPPGLGEKAQQTGPLAVDAMSQRPRERHDSAQIIQTQPSNSPYANPRPAEPGRLWTVGLLVLLAAAAVAVALFLFLRG